MGRGQPLGKPWFLLQPPKHPGGFWGARQVRGGTGMSIPGWVFPRLPEAWEVPGRAGIPPRWDVLCQQPSK